MMPNHDAAPNDERLAGSSATRSTAQQVVYWLMLVSLLVAVAVMGAWWIAEGIPLTASTTFIFMFATMGLWMMIYQSFIFAIKQLVKNRIAQRKAEGT